MPALVAFGSAVHRRQGAQADATVMKSPRGHFLSIVKIAAIEDHRRLHLEFDVVKVRVSEFIPLSHDCDCIGSVTGIVRGPGGNLDLILERVDDESSIAITRALVTAGIGVAEVVKESESLEERFLAITSTAAPAEIAEATP